MIAQKRTQASLVTTNKNDEKAAHLSSRSLLECFFVGVANELEPLLLQYR